jgi:superfamily II DNA or RNA helicase
MTPYPFQSKIINESRKAVRDGYKKILICTPTGSGKTVIFSFITKYAEAKGKKILIGVHREKIVRQILKTLYKLGVQAGQIVSGKSMTKDYVQVGMVLTIKNRLHLLKHFDIIIFDECHHAAAKTYMDILAYFPDVLHIGVTATPWRLDNIGLGEIYQKMLLGPPTSWHVEKKMLKYPVMKRAPKQVTEKFKTVGKDFDKKAQKKAFTENI